MSRCHSKTVWDIGTWEVLESQFSEYSGTWELAKGDGVARDQLNLNNRLVQQEIDRRNALQDQATQAVKAFLSGNKGFSDDQLAAMRSQFMNSNDQTFKSAAEQVRSYLTSKGANGGELPLGGDSVRTIAELEAAKANSQSSGLLGIDVTNAQQALQNLFNASNVFSGTAADTGKNVGAFSGSASNALNQYVAASNTGFGNAFTTAFGGSLGSNLGSVTTPSKGGFGLPCWIAIELYGEHDPRTGLLRHCIFSVWNRKPVGKVFAAAYRRYGQRIASHIRSCSVSRAIVKALFDCLLVAAKDVPLPSEPSEAIRNLFSPKNVFSVNFAPGALNAYLTGARDGFAR